MVLSIFDRLNSVRLDQGILWPGPSTQATTIFPNAPVLWKSWYVHHHYCFYTRVLSHSAVLTRARRGQRYSSTQQHYPQLYTRLGGSRFNPSWHEQVSTRPNASAQIPSSFSIGLIYLCQVSEARKDVNVSKFRATPTSTPRRSNGRGNGQTLPAEIH